MRVRIHRGAREIGGNCVEVEAGNARLVLDLGRPLTAGWDDQVPLPALDGLTGDPAGFCGVVLSHPHEDHYGLVRQIAASVPVYLGEAAARILREAAFFSRGLDVTPAGFLVHRRRFEVGPFRITPYLVDHSAFDAYALLVEADGQRLFYTGDLRAYGRKAALFERLVRHPPVAVDALLIEGTQVRADDTGTRSLPSEAAVEDACVATFTATPGLALAVYSPQNVDRLVTLYRAARRAGRTFVMDLYTAAVAAATGRTTIPQASWEGVRVYVPQRQRVAVLRAAAFDRVAAIRSQRVYADELRRTAGHLVLTFRGSMCAEVERIQCLTGAACIWSLWPGYLAEPAGIRLQEWLARHEIPLVDHHASGHATPQDLARLVAAFSPRRTVPIHTSAPERFAALFPRVERHADGAWWDL